MTAMLEAPAEGQGEERVAAEPAGYRWRWLAFSAVLASTVMDLLDSTVVGVAAPAIRADLGGSYASLQWMGAGYTMALAVLLLIGGRLGDMFGRRRMLLLGVGGFAVASLACALAVTPELLITFRVLQGAFSAVMIPQGFGLIRDLFPPAEMVKAWGVFGPIMGLSAMLGPIIGGGLVDADILGTGWRAIFLINLPIGAFAFVVAAKFLPAAAPGAGPRRLDLGGVLLAAAGTFLLIYPLVQGRELGWPAWTAVMLAAAVAVLAVFGWYQVRRKRTGRSQLIETSVFGRKSYVSGVLFAVIFFAAMGGMFIVGIFLQLGLAYSPMEASLTMAPWALGAMIGSGFGGALMPKLGRRILHIGLALMGAGVVGLYVVYTSAGIGISGWDFIVPNLIGGLGMGMIFVPLFDIILGDVADHEVGSATGALGSFEQLGLSLGVAVIGTIFFSLLGGHGGGAHLPSALDGAEQASVVTFALIVVAFAVGFLLPKRARVGAPAH
ncbi:MAG TPA: MFS transporter [Actinophytocola sp.]|uniref:MFS transporter n=1 Tax=Actinophytocola sp. TaxID=1872138 RepID=UPI002DDC9BA0|nr:MFS transporter [Actinophytocola sp.]HEV2779560.1 MFS transporter [Actinophytocola sp.]